MGLLESLQDHLKKMPEEQLAEVLELVSALEKKKKMGESMNSPYGAHSHSKVQWQALIKTMKKYTH